MDLADWVDDINKQSQTLSQDDYWKYIWRTAEQLTKKYEGNKLVFAIVQEHIYFLGASADGEEYEYKEKTK